jgi:hypothetical protein
VLLPTLATGPTAALHFSLSLATARRRSPAAETLHHKHYAVVLLIQSISPSYLLDQGGRIRRYAVRVHRSEAQPVVVLGSDRIARRRWLVRLHHPLCDFFKGMKISSISLVDYIS